MQSYAILLRGINVGGKNKISMAELKQCLEKLGFGNVSTYIASGNVIVQSDKSAIEIKAQIETLLPKTFKLDSELIRVLVLSRDQLQAVVNDKPRGFGDQPDKYQSDAIFLIDIPSVEAIKAFKPKEGVDTVWQGDGVIYSQRLSELRTKSHLNQAMSTPAYKLMTIRSWNTTVKLLDIINSIGSKRIE